MWNERSRQFFVFCLLCFFSYGAPYSLVAAEKPPQKKLQLVKQELLQINRDLKKSKSLKNKQVKKVQAFDSEIARLNKKLKRVGAKKEATNKEIKGLKERSALIAQSIASSKKNLTEMSRALYLLGDENYLKILMNHGKAGEQARMRVYYDYFYRAFNEQQNMLLESLAQLTQIDDALAEKLIQYDRLLEDNKKQMLALKDKRSNKKAFLSKLDRQIKDKQRQMSTLTSSRNTLKKLIKALERRKHREKMQKLSGMSFAKSKGRLKWPVTGKVRRKYGQSRGDGGLKWRGVLLSAKAGEKVKAVDGGMVVFADWLSSYGFVLIIDHGKNYMTLYGHNQQLLKDVGDKVLRGDVVAEAGSSGRLDKPGVYFEIRRKGRPVNPSKWMIARKTR